MEARLQTRVQRYGWDAAVTHYHSGWESQLQPAHDRLLEMAGPPPGHRVIEIACGSGLVTKRLAEQIGPTGRLLATDFSQGMIDDLRSRLNGPRFAHVETARMAAEELDVPDGAFDGSICALGLMYTPDPAAALIEMERVVSPGGTVATTVWGERRNCGWAEVFPIVDARVASEVCPLFFGTGAPGALQGLFRTAGPDQIEEQRHFETLVYASAEDVIGAILLGGPVALAAKRFSDDVWDEVKNEFLGSIATFRQDDGSYRIPGEFVTIKGTVPSR
jgi:SAM-dependent methyltransferase